MATIELPLFPLHTVLFPGTPLNVHVFEPRYRLLVGTCLEHEVPFGVALIRAGEDAMGPLPEPHLVGCSARITGVHNLAGGRMNVDAVGTERFRILTVRRDSRPYLVGEVEMLPLADGEPEAVSASESRLRRWVTRYLDVIEHASAGDFSFTADQLPHDARSLGFLAASILPIPARQKQPLLAVHGLVELLDATAAIYRRELPLLQEMVGHRDDVLQGPFSRN